MAFEHPDSLYPLAIVLGLGEIGRPIYEMIKDSKPNHIVKGYDPAHHDEAPEGHFGYMHVCFPLIPNFVQVIKEYAEKYTPNHIVIHCTPTSGMTMQVLEAMPKGIMVYYSPVRGNIKDGMKWSLARYAKYVGAPGGGTAEEHEDILLHLASCGFNPKWVGEAEALEWAKLLDLAWYGLNIAFFQEAERILEDRDLPWNTLKDFMESTPIESEGKVQRSVFYGGHVGGHCVIQAIEKILSQVDVPVLREVLASNMHRKFELMHGKPEHHP